MSEKDLLISRIIDREETTADWRRLDEMLAETATTTERAHLARPIADRLFDGLRADAALREAMDRAFAVADTVSIPLVTPPLGTEKAPPVGRMRNPWLAQWSGWMAAAALALLWMATDPRMKRAPAEPTSAVAADQIETPGTTQARLADDDVVRELPDVMVETRPIPGSDKVEVFFVRRTLERAVVSDAFTLSRDETGQPIQARVDLTRYAPKRNY